LLTSIIHVCPHCAAKLEERSADGDELKKWYCPKCRVRLTSDEAVKRTSAQDTK